MIIGLQAYLDGSTHSTSGLLQSLAGGYAIFRALDGPLGEVLAAENIGGELNPAAGRHPDLEDPTWVGGSLGGTMGAIEVRPLLNAWYPSELDARLAIAMGQNAWDDVDGAIWEDPDADVLLQESIGDPIQPNIGTAMFARARGATVVGVPLDGMLGDLPTAEEVEGVTGITQYRTSGDMYDVHGFAATNSQAGQAAMEQIRVYMESTAGGHPHIVVPTACLENGSCDFGE